MKEPEMAAIADMISEVVLEVRPNELPDDKDARIEYLKKFRSEIAGNPKIENVRSRVLELCSRFPLYPEIKA